MKLEMKYRESPNQKLNKFVGDEKQLTIVFEELIKKHSQLTIKVHKVN